MKLEKRFLKLSSFLSVWAMVPAVIAFIGLVLSQPALRKYGANLPSMNLETVLGVLFLGISIIALNRAAENHSANTEKYRQIARLSLMVFIGAFTATFCFYFIYYFTLKNKAQLPDFISSLRTSTAFLVIGLCTYTASFQARWRTYALLFLTIPFYIALVAITGYVIDATSFFVEIKDIGMSIPTGISTILLTFAIALGPARNAGNGFLLSKGIGGKMIRQFLPLALLAPPLFTWANLYSRSHNLISMETSALIQVTVPCFVLFIAIGYMGYKLIDSERKLKNEKQMQENLRALNKAKDEFLAVLSHELRTPMHAIVGFVELLPEYDPKSENYQRAYDMIKKNAQSEMRLIENILDVSQLVTGKLSLNREPFSLPCAVKDVYFSFKDEMDQKKINSTLHLDNSVLEYHGDKERICQIFKNLISNAIKFTPPGGRISVALRQDDQYVQFVVQDTGTGMSALQIEKAFDSFWQGDSTSNAEYGGLGMGLTLAQKLAKLHGGDIQIHSDGIGMGSRLKALFPAV